MAIATRATPCGLALRPASAQLADLGADIALHRADRPFMRLAIRTPKGTLLLAG